MKAAILTSYGTAEVLEISDVPKPQLQADEVLVHVHAAAVNPKDTFIRKGRFRWFSGDRFPMLAGFDFAGEVSEVGAMVKVTKVGDAVYGMLDGWQGGTFAEYVAVKANQLSQKPEILTFEEAAAMPLVSLTALQALRDKARIKEGQEVCINGASGGVGSMAVQIANIHKAIVTAISAKHNHDFLHQLGAIECIDYHHADITKNEPRFNIFFDVFGNQRFKAIKPILKDSGVWVSTVVQPHVFLSVAKTMFFSRKKAKLVVVKSSREDLTKVREWVEAGEFKPIVHEIYPLEKIREAYAQQETKHTRGKVVIRI